jgi:hypothetical protein
MELEKGVIPSTSTSERRWQNAVKELVNTGGELLIVGSPDYLSELEGAIKRGSILETLSLFLLGNSGALPYPGVARKNFSKLFSVPMFRREPGALDRTVSLLVSGELLGFGVAGVVAGIIELLKRGVETSTVELDGGSGLILRLLK